MATGIAWYDRSREKDGDYIRLGFLGFSDLRLELTKDCRPADIVDIEKDAAVIQAKRGQHYQVSGCGQTVRLGQ